MLSQQNTPNTERLLPARDVYKDRLGISKSSFYGLVKSGEFPKPVRITKQRVGWRESIVDEWVRNRTTVDAEPKAFSL